MRFRLEDGCNRLRYQVKLMGDTRLMFGFRRYQGPGCCLDLGDTGSCLDLGDARADCCLKVVVVLD